MVGVRRTPSVDENTDCIRSESIAPGANYLANPIDIMGMAHHGFLSPNGKCYSFDHRANG